MKTTAAALVAAAALAAPAKSQVSDEIVDATIGEYLIASEDGSPGCRIMLEKNKTIGGRVVREGKSCAAPWHDQVASWDFPGDGGITLRDATRKEIITFEEQEGGPYKTPLDVTPVVYFIPTPGKMDRIPVAKNVVGPWVLTDKKGKALCGINLLDKASARLEDAKAIELSPDCSASVKKTKADAWQISEIQLVIIGGEDWVYTLTSDGDGFTTGDGKFHLKRDAK